MSWWVRTLREGTILARQAAPGDRARVSALLANTWRRHGAQATEEQIVLLNNGVSTVASAGDDVAGILGLKVRGPAGEPAETWVDVSLAAVSPNLSPERVLRALLEAALPELRIRRSTGLVCLVSQGWLQSALAQIGFAEVDRVLSYVWSARRQPAAPAPRATLRPAGARDSDTILVLNGAAFVPFWRYDPATLLSWAMTADHAVLAEVDGCPAGFAITTNSSSADCAQLIRVATHPAFQGRGIGRQMVADAMCCVYGNDRDGLALNTQASNRVARHLYETLGFRQNGQAVKVMTYRCA